jgi:hypothetical protein
VKLYSPRSLYILLYLVYAGALAECYRVIGVSVSQRFQLLPYLGVLLVLTASYTYCWQLITRKSKPRTLANRTRLVATSGAWVGATIAVYLYLALYAITTIHWDKYQF